MATFAQQREAVWRRHADVLVRPRSQTPSFAYESVRKHPRWAQLVEGGHDEGSEPLAATPAAPADVQTGSDDRRLLGPAFIPSESTVRNDYSQRFVDTGTGGLPSNAVRNPYQASRFVEYPKLRRLIEAKASLVDATSIAPTYIQADLLQSIATSVSSEQPVLGEGAQAQNMPAPFHLTTLAPIRYDAVLIDPPLEAYEWESIPSVGRDAKQVWSWDQVAALPIPQIVAKESFVFLWVGSGAGDGLERGREVLMRWGYRRCEDIVWIRTNDHDQSEASTSTTQPPTSSAFARATQHCLMGIRGTIRRSTDTRFVHCNIDTDVILWPGERDESQSGAGVIDERSKPPEMMDLIEHFCLGTRRLELFGRNRNLRRGWLTVGLDVGPDRNGWQDAVEGRNACAAGLSISEEASDRRRQLSPVQYHKPLYDSAFGVDRIGCTLAERSNLVPFDAEVDALRPRSPRSDAERNNTQPRYHDGKGAGLRGGTGPHSARFTPPIALAALPTGGEYLDPMTMRAAAPYEQAFYLSSHPPFPLLPAQQQAQMQSATNVPGGAGLSGLGAGGREVVSVPSGSEMLSGAQASVLLSQSQQQRRDSAAAAQGERTGAPTDGSAAGGSHAGPAGLSRRGRRV